MPTSRAFPVPYICERILKVKARGRTINPKVILDIGVGFGKWGFLAREYTDVFWGRLHKSEWKSRIDGIEIFEGYITELHRYIYDNIYIGDATEVIKTLGNYDIIICSDMLEHLEKDKGLRFLEDCRRHAAVSLFALPIDPGNRPGGRHGNPHEAHISHWERVELEEFGRVIEVGDLQYILDMSRK